MPGAPSRRRLLGRLALAATVPLAGCSADRSSPSRPPPDFEPRDTEPVRARGDPVTVERSASSLEPPVVDDGSIDPGDDGAPDPFVGWTASRSVELAADAVRDVLAARVERLDAGTGIGWTLRWDRTRSRFLLTTTTRIRVPTDPSVEIDVAFPSPLYDEIESAAPATVSVAISTADRATTYEFPVFARARLRRR